MPHDALCHQYLETAKDPTVGGFAEYARKRLANQILLAQTCDDGSCAYCDGIRDAAEVVLGTGFQGRFERHPDLRFGTPAPAVRVPIDVLQGLVDAIEGMVLDGIEARNPGIDRDEVIRHRRARGDEHPAVMQLSEALRSEIRSA